MTKEQCESILQENNFLVNKYFVRYSSNLKIQLIRMDMKNMSGMDDEYFVQCVFKTNDRNLPYFLESFSKVLEQSDYRLHEQYV